jgi:hypothetical protein
MVRVFISFIFSLFFFSAVAQDRYWIRFTDKGNQDFSSIQLSEQSLLRRENQGYVLDSTDIPVFQNYIDSISFSNIKIRTKSRWFNAVSAYLTDVQLEELNKSNFSFVKSIQPVNQLTWESSEVSMIPYASKPFPKEYYGEAYPAINQIKGQELHKLGFEGQGIHIAVIDAGFTKTKEHPVFEQAFIENRISEGIDFVQFLQPNIQFDFSEHGKMVLSTMAAFQPGEYVGTAPKANYTLIRTEEGAKEDVIEEDYWVMGAEYADSIGVDMINSSLGYSLFDDSLQNHSYEDMDGESTIISRAADIAMDKGILVVTSAGNSGNSPWHYITAPADAKKVLTVGAVNEFGESASFSSHGPTFDGRIKPNVVGHGANISVAYGSESIIQSNGTSFSGPVICGMTACLWQFLKKNYSGNTLLTNRLVIEMLEKSASHYTKPDSNMGYGIPNYAAIIKPYLKNPITEWTIAPNPVADNSPTLYGDFSDKVTIRIFNTQGKLLMQKEDPWGKDKIQLKSFQDFPSGMYLVEILHKQETKLLKIVK